MGEQADIDYWTHYEEVDVTCPDRETIVKNQRAALMRKYQAHIATLAREQRDDIFAQIPSFREWLYQEELKNR